MKYGFLSDVRNVDFTLPRESTFNSFLIDEATCKDVQIYVGPSVWSDKDYVGTFFPPKTPQRSFLSAYSKQFNSVEVNATRYGVPKETTLQKWADAVSDDFKFAFKLPQIITQRTDLLSKDVLDRLDQYILAIEKINHKVGSNFILLQNNFPAERLTELEQFLKHLPTEQNYSVELRNPEVNQSQELGELLNNYNCAHVITDTAGRRDVVHQMITGNKVFIRFVGNGLVDTDFKRIDAWILKLKKWIKQGVNEVYFLIHQPEQRRTTSAILAKYAIDQMNIHLPNTNLKSPVDYTQEAPPTLF